MDIKQLWLNVQDLWGALDEHPLLHASLGFVVLLVVALLLGRVARSVLPPAEIPLGLLTALLGAPFFLLLLTRARPAA